MPDTKTAEGEADDSKKEFGKKDADPNTGADTDKGPKSTNTPTN